MEKVWALVSDSDRFNRHLGTVFTFRESLDASGRVLRVGEERSLGLTFRWEERVFDFQAPRGFHVERVFENGPVARIHVDLKLGEEEKKTKIYYAISIWPSSAVGRFLVKARLVGVRRKVSGAFEEILKLLEGRNAKYDVPPPSLSKASRERVSEAERQLEPRAFGVALAHHIRTAPLHEQDRMAPLRLARLWGLDENVVIDGCLAAVRLGVLSMTWDLLCPSCHGAKSRRETLEDETYHADCPSCNVSFTVSPVSLAVSFRPAPTIRAIKIAPRCIGSPARTPHILVRERLEPNKGLYWTLPLEQGGYRIRAQTSLRAANLEVREGLEPGVVTVRIGESGVQPALLRVGTGAVTVVVDSHLRAPEWIVLERRWDAQDVLTAGRLLERHALSRLLPPGSIAKTLVAQVTRSCVLVVESLEDDKVLASVERRLATERPHHVYRGTRSLVARWLDFDALLGAIRVLEGTPEICGAATVGAIVELAGENSRLPAGQAVEDAFLALRISLPGRTVLASSAVVDEEVSKVLGRKDPGLRLVEGPRVEGHADYLIDFGVVSSGAGSQGPWAELPEIGTDFVGRYRLERVLGSGGFGTVFEAKDLQRAQQRVVVKVLSPSLGANPTVVQQFFNEARACSLIGHRNVVAITDFGHAKGGILYFVMEFVGGLGLDQLLGRRALSLRESCFVAQEVLSGLVAARDHGIAHRDIKPSNILLSEESGLTAVKLIDFGIARIEGEADLMDGQLVGTPMYMSPEQCRSEGGDGRSDLYALGLVMWACLLGRPPGADLPPAQLILGRLSGPLPDIRDLAKDAIPLPLCALIMKAVAADAQDRFQTARDMLHELRRVACELQGPLELRWTEVVPEPIAPDPRDEHPTRAS